GDTLHPSRSAPGGPGGEVVALKRLRAPGDPRWLASVRDQTRTLAGLSHASLIRIHEVITETDELQIAMQYFAGGSLADMLERKGSLPGPSVAMLIAEVADALTIAHDHGLLHLDIKPSNVLLDSKGWPALSDFGHARLTATTGQPTPANTEYFDPALAEGQAPGPSSDIYSLGVVCYQAITGVLPFSGDTPLQVLRSARTQPFRPLVEAAPDTSPALAAAVERAMARRPQDRFQTADELSSALRGAIGMPVVDFGRPPRARRARPELAWPWRRAPAPQPAATPISPPRPRPRSERARGRRPEGAPSAHRMALWSSRHLQSGVGLALVGMMIFAALILPRVLSSRTDNTSIPKPATPARDSKAPRPENVRDDADIPSGTPLAEGHPAASVPPPPASRQPPRPKAQTELPDAGPSADSSASERSETAQLAPAPAAPAPQPPAPPPPAPAHEVSTVPVRPPARPGRQIAFTSNQDGNREIYMVNRDGTGLANLTNHAASDRQPAMSPDASRIAFVSNREGNDDVYLMNSDGTGVQRLTSNSGSDTMPAWSPDGAQIAFTSNQGGNEDIYVMRADGTGTRRLTSEFHADSQPTWSPDGSRIAFVSSQGGNLNIFVMDAADGSNLKGLTADQGGFNRSPDWSARGRLAFINADFNSFPEIRDMTGDGGEPRALTPGTNPSWSPDGDSLAFERNGEVHLRNPDGTLRQLTDSGRTASDPDW
ncbi:MAG: LpqB family beta-propeller domain-containing protein, partial [Actinomycetota bacterium]